MVRFLAILIFLKIKHFLIDNQRGHGGGGNIITFFESRKYKIANSFMLAWPYGFAQVCLIIIFF
jgi:hypothetical protein